ncbi:MAG: manganese efflux pump MntP family protein [Nitrososphaeria archaeon]|nr:manganese efflux pump MntP family protein [Nitrososphaeria archaeon]MDW8021915.1 manganese efflux pump [Nitrososphaerota archaeon]
MNIIAAAIAIGLALDCFSVALGKGMGNRRIDRASTLKTALTFGAFHIVMLSLGWGMGSRVAELISELDHWVAFGLLSATGVHMLYDAFHRDKSDPNPGMGIKSLLSLSIATSIDTLIIGFSLPFLKIQLLLMAPLVGITSSTFTALGWYLGTRVRLMMGEKSEAIGGAILILIGLEILLEHLLR